jgi:hypothetical protein
MLATRDSAPALSPAKERDCRSIVILLLARRNSSCATFYIFTVRTEPG